MKRPRFPANAAGSEQFNEWMRHRHDPSDSESVRLRAMKARAEAVKAGAEDVMPLRGSAAEASEYNRGLRDAATIILYGHASRVPAEQETPR